MYRLSSILQLGERLISEGKNEIPINSQDTNNLVEENVTKDDLSIIEGIGPKIKEILQKNNLNTWESIASSSKEKIKEILLKEGGERYKIHDPTSWPKQAKLAYQGKWAELKILQDKLKGGK